MWHPLREETRIAAPTPREYETVRGWELARLLHIAAFERNIVPALSPRAKRGARR
jgi:hypothetical protein